MQCLRVSPWPFKYTAGNHGGNSRNHKRPRHIKRVVHAYKDSCPSNGHAQQQNGNGRATHALLRKKRLYLKDGGIAPSSEELPAQGACPRLWCRPDNSLFSAQGAEKQKGVTVSSNPLKSGGEGEIRTPGTLLTYTRFPIVLLRPARTPLHSVINHRSKPNTCIAAS